MNEIIPSFENIVFMMYGNKEKDAEKIIEEKQEDYRNTGKNFFWGYNGTCCHPVNQILRFIKGKAKVYLILSRTNGKIKNKLEEEFKCYKYCEADENKPKIKDYAEIMKPLPEGIRVTASEFALVCSELIPINITINLSDYYVGVGDNYKKNASQYISGHNNRGQNSKGCLCKYLSASELPSELKPINYYAEIIPPYAVFVR